MHSRKAVGYGHGHESYTDEQQKEKQVLREAIHVLNTHGSIKNSYKD
jgi:hypothetical protein